MSKASVAFNGNLSARVKLTDVGLAAYAEKTRELNTRIPPARAYPLVPTLDEDGYFRAPLWVLMADFGHLFILGHNPPFEMDILLDPKDVRLTSPANAEPLKPIADEEDAAGNLYPSVGKTPVTRDVVRALFREACHGGGADARNNARTALEKIIAQQGAVMHEFFDLYGINLSHYFASRPIGA